MTTIVVGVTNHSSALAACNRAFELARPGDQIHLVYAVGGRGAEAETAHRHADGLLETLQLSSNRPVSVHTVQGSFVSILPQVLQMTIFSIAVCSDSFE